MVRHAEIDKDGMVETGFSEKPSPVIELVDKAHSDKIIAWACSKCGMILPDERLAREHCLPRICECGNECRQYHTACDACIKKKRVERDRVKREAAEVISADDYDGSVYDEQEDRYFPNIGEAFEVISDEMDFDEKTRKARTLWTCNILKFRPDAGGVIDQELERGEHCEEAAAMFSTSATKALQSLLDGWVKEHAYQVEAWIPSGKKRVEIPPKWWSDYDEGLRDDDTE